MSLIVDYSKVGWIQNAVSPEGRPVFAVTGNPDYVLGERAPRIWNKRYYSADLTQALPDNGACTTLPLDLATAAETPSRTDASLS